MIEGRETYEKGAQYDGGQGADAGPEKDRTDETTSSGS